ncbi:hypothetical protein QBC36DRAFT_34816 [Triangularia setosa]|uniref:Secreted protein n=1 Tax=Triangularia setosa TaxID=2587417 RepID=A0AAN6W3X3_9PEZI|nr:hypothetical protein QBC36DRAFT_34816 [Podospora setosa]
MGNMLFFYRLASSSLSPFCLADTSCFKGGGVLCGIPNHNHNCLLYSFTLLTIAHCLPHIRKSSVLTQSKLVK